MLILTVHASVIKDKVIDIPVNNLVDILNLNHKEFIYVQHSINGEFESKVLFYKNGILEKIDNIATDRKNSIKRYISEIISTFIYIKNLKLNKKIIYIGTDPLNAITGLFLKIFNICETSIFYSVDYSTKRFEKFFLNLIYQTIDYINSIFSDEVWSVSRRIFQVRERYKVNKNKNIFFPNVPSKKFIKYLTEEKNTNQLITLGMLADQIDYYGLFNLVKQLKKGNPKIILKVLGGGPKEEEFKKFVIKEKLSENIIFLGQVDHETALKEISKSYIGFALYNGNWGFNYFGDSMKCREYFSFGIPVITTNTHSTVEDIGEFKAGLVVDQTVDSYLKAYYEINKRYDYYSNNAKKLSEMYLNIGEQILEKYWK